MLRQLSTGTTQADQSKAIDRPAINRPVIGEDILRLLEASLDSIPGFLPDIADHAGLTVPEAIRLGDLLAHKGLLLAFDDEPWAPTIEGYRLIQHRRSTFSAERSPRTSTPTNVNGSEGASRG